MKTGSRETARFRDSGFGRMLIHAWQRSQGTLSLRVIWICVGLFVGIALLDALGVADRRQTISFLGLSYAGVFQRHWIHQVVTAPLLHFGVMHLVFNMLVLWMLGPDVEKILGRLRYIVFSVVCAISSMLGFLVLNWGSGAIVAGYSGVIFGIFVAQAIYFPDRKIIMFWFFPIRMKYAAIILTAVALYLTVSPEAGGVGHAAHLFGALGAFVYIQSLRFRQARRSEASVPRLQMQMTKRARRKSRPNIPKQL